MPSGNREGSEFNEASLGEDLARKIRDAFGGTVIWCGGFTRERASPIIGDPLETSHDASRRSGPGNREIAGKHAYRGIIRQ
jgi:hypothetical protein